VRAWARACVREWCEGLRELKRSDSTGLLRKTIQCENWWRSTAARHGYVSSVQLQTPLIALQKHTLCSLPFQREFLGKRGGLLCGKSRQRWWCFGRV
jgi:hypothetical protein